jgi:hypothetical protein
MIKKRDFEDSFCVSEATSLKNETKVYEHDFLISSSLKNETRLEHGFLISSSLKNETTFEDIFCISVATSLKNEIEVMSIVLVSMSSSLKNETVFPPLYLSQVLHLVFEASFHSPL